ncbi:MAG: hypothetical protein ACYCQJ_01910 [Nitrososphaerales archaeon]
MSFIRTAYRKDNFRKRFAIATPGLKKVLVVLAVILLLAQALTTQTQANASSQVLTNAENFLVSQYNASIGLLVEYPGASTYWLYSDNYLALLAFNQANSSNQTKQTIIMNNVSSTLDRYMSLVPSTDAKNQYMVFTSNVFNFNNSRNYELITGEGSFINITLNNITGTLDPHSYGDIAFLEAIYYNNIGNKSGALSLFNIGANMYNGIGINDSAFYSKSNSSHVYQTYKLALYIYVAKLLGQSYPPSVESTLLDMQDTTSGGFYSGYNSSYSTSGHEENVETTSLAILALAYSSTSSTTTSSLANTSTSTNTSTSKSSTSDSSSVQSRASTSASSSTTESNTGPGIPEFPFQFVITLIFTIVIVLSYVIVTKSRFRVKH